LDEHPVRFSALWLSAADLNRRAWPKRRPLPVCAKAIYFNLVAPQGVLRCDLVQIVAKSSKGDLAAVSTAATVD
jgi:hypothetical protein